jgi:hypothetical protein
MEFVGFVWTGDDARIDFEIEAASLHEAPEAVLAQYGEEYSISIWNEEDAHRRR